MENFYVDVPVELEVLNVPSELTREYNKFKWYGTLDPLEEKESKIEFKVKSTKEHIVKVRAEYIINNLRKTLGKTLKLNTSEILIIYIQLLYGIGGLILFLIEIQI